MQTICDLFYWTMFATNVIEIDNLAQIDIVSLSVYD